MWMTPLSLRRQNTVNNYLTHQLTGPTYTIHCRGIKPRSSTAFPWHLGFSRFQQQLVTNVYRKPTHTYTGTVTISLQHTIVSTTLQHLGLKKSRPVNKHYKKKRNTSTKPYRLASSHHCPSTLYITNLTASITATMDMQTIQQPTKGQQQQWIQQQKHFYCGTLHPWFGGKV